jgi:hypothetical protein
MTCRLEQNDVSAQTDEEVVFSYPTSRERSETAGSEAGDGDNECDGCGSRLPERESESESCSGHDDDDARTADPVQPNSTNNILVAVDEGNFLVSPVLPAVSVSKAADPHPQDALDETPAHHSSSSHPPSLRPASASQQEGEEKPTSSPKSKPPQEDLTPEEEESERRLERKFRMRQIDREWNVYDIEREYKQVFLRVIAEAKANAGKPRGQRRDINAMLDDLDKRSWRVNQRHRQEAADFYREVGRDEALRQWEDFLVSGPIYTTDSNDGEIVQTWLLHAFIVNQGTPIPTMDDI